MLYFLPASKWKVAERSVARAARPVIDQGLAVNPEAHAVVGAGVDRVVASRRRPQEPSKRAENVSGAMVGRGEPVPQLKLTLPTVRLVAGPVSVSVS